MQLDHSMMHLLFMGYLKVYTQSPRAPEIILEVVDRMSHAVGMDFGHRKYAVVHVSKGKLVDRENLFSYAFCSQQWQHVPISWH